MSAHKKLLLVFHTQTGHTGRLAAACLEGARDPAAGGEVRVRSRRALLATLDDLLWCDALLLAAPENLGRLAGGMKHFLDLCYYPALGRRQGLPCCLIVGAGNDGRGAVRDFEKVVAGQHWRLVREPLICRGRVTEAQLAACRELGLYLAAALDAGVI